jgi:hypothetical protein
MAREPQAPATIVQRFVAAINQQDLEGALSCVSASIVTAVYGGSTETVGMRALGDQLAESFAVRPKLRVAVQGRFLASDRVIQNENFGAGLTGGEKRVTIYQVAGELITRIEYLR